MGDLVADDPFLNSLRHTYSKVFSCFCRDNCIKMLFYLLPYLFSGRQSRHFATLIRLLQLVSRLLLNRRYWCVPGGRPLPGMRVVNYAKRSFRVRGQLTESFVKTPSHDPVIFDTTSSVVAFRLTFYSTSSQFLFRRLRRGYLRPCCL